MALTRKQKKKLAWADAIEGMFGKNSSSQVIRSEVRRVEKRKRKQFAKETKR